MHAAPGMSGGTAGDGVSHRAGRQRKRRKEGGVGWGAKRGEVQESRKDARVRVAGPPRARSKARTARTDPAGSRKRATRGIVRTGTAAGCPTLNVARTREGVSDAPPSLGTCSGRRGRGEQRGARGIPCWYAEPEFQCAQQEPKCEKAGEQVGGRGRGCQERGKRGSPAVVAVPLPYAEKASGKIVYMATEGETKPTQEAGPRRRRRAPAHVTALAGWRRHGRAAGRRTCSRRVSSRPSPESR